MRIIVLAALLLAASAANAQLVYRCTDATGKVQLSDKACGIDAVEGSRVLLKPNTLDGSQGRELNLRAENERLRQQVENERASANRAPASPNPNSPECREATMAAKRTGSKDDRARANAACMGSEAAAQIEQARAAERASRRPVITNCHNAGFGNTQCVSR